MAYKPCLKCHVYNKLTRLRRLYLGIDPLVCINNLLITPVGNVLMRLGCEKWMVCQYHDITGHNYILILFAESDGETPGNFEGENTTADLKSSKQNLQLSDVVNIFVSVTGTCKVICLFLYSASQ